MEPEVPSQDLSLIHICLWRTSDALGALLIGAAVAGLCGFLIGIPVLRLKGDYLAIVTLAFGEIIKNLINVMYVGVDQHGFHFSIKDTTSLGMDDTGVVIIKGRCV